ncbi:MAG TPA: transporter [Holophagaceae bacterium]|jgi:hypothetical protein|nr:transporter [Holophagaceae bacterium]
MFRVLACFLLCAGFCFPAWAGPPFKTDDPAPVDLGHLEFYAFAAGQRGTGDSSGAGPAFEFNYGILPETQFHIVVPVAYDRPEGGPSQRGLGDTEVGFKVRFLKETDTLPQIGIFPLVEIPTGDAEKGLGAGHTQVYIPIWIQKSWGAWTTYGGYGWWRNPGEGARDWSYAGWLLQRDLGQRLTLGGELFHTTASTADGRSSNGFNLGGQVNFGEKHHLLFSAGRNFSGETQSYFYFGYQLTTGTFGNLGDWFRGARHS